MNKPAWRNIYQHYWQSVRSQGMSHDEKYYTLGKVEWLADNQEASQLNTMDRTRTGSMISSPSFFSARLRHRYVAISSFSVSTHLNMTYFRRTSVAGLYIHPPAGHYAKKISRTISSNIACCPDQKICGRFLGSDSFDAFLFSIYPPIFQRRIQGALLGVGWFG